MTIVTSPPPCQMETFFQDLTPLHLLPPCPYGDTLTL